MKLLTFAQGSDPSAAPLLGVLIEGDRTIVNLQAGSLVMAGTPEPFFADMLAFLDAGEAAVNVKSPVLQPGDELNPMLQAGTGCRLSAPSRDSPALC